MKVSSATPTSAKVGKHEDCVELPGEVEFEGRLVVVLSSADTVVRVDEVKEVVAAVLVVLASVDVEIVELEALDDDGLELTLLDILVEIFVDVLLV